MEEKVTGKLPAQPVKIFHSGFGTGHLVEAESEFCVWKSLAQPVTFYSKVGGRRTARRDEVGKTETSVN